MRIDTIIIFALFAVFALIEMTTRGLFNKKNAIKGDGFVELVSTLGLLIVTQPLILAGVFFLGITFFPSYQNALIALPFAAQFLLFVIFDDLTQYWWHRASHSFAWLYKLHRPHHNGGYMSVRLVYRNNIFYYALMPSIWLSGALIYLGMVQTFIIYIVIKLGFITGAHCDWHWDAPLYKIKALAPIMWVVERLFSTPSTHSMHHGKHKEDGVTHYKGNYGNMLFLWDVIFGTAKITRQRPEQYGVENLPDTSVGEQLLWPLIRAKDEAG